MQSIKGLVCEFVRDLDGELRISSRQQRRVESIERVRQQRDDQQQVLAFNSRPFVLCGLPIRRPPKSVLKHTRRNGKFLLEVVGHPDYGLPFGQDRLVPLWVATLAVRQKSRVVSFRSAAEILEEFGLPRDGPHYRRLVDAFKRIFTSTIYFGTESTGGREQLWDHRRFHFFDAMKIWCGPTSAQDILGSATENTLMLSEAFWKEIEAHPIPVDIGVVRELTNIPGCLDLYMWLVWRCYTAKTTERIALFGKHGLATQLGVPEYTRDRNFRKRLRTWIRTVQTFWAECPARISEDGGSLIIAPATAITTVRTKRI